MKKRNARAWIASFALAAALVFIGLRAHPKMWGLYIQFPGIVAGLLTGYFAGSRSTAVTDFLVVGTTILLNAACYYWACRITMLLLSAVRPNSR